MRLWRHVMTSALLSNLHCQTGAGYRRWDAAAAFFMGEPTAVWSFWAEGATKHQVVLAPGRTFSLTVCSMLVRLFQGLPWGTEDTLHLSHISICWDAADYSLQDPNLGAGTAFFSSISSSKGEKRIDHHVAAYATVKTGCYPKLPCQGRVILGTWGLRIGHTIELPSPS